MNGLQAAEALHQILPTVPPILFSMIVSQPEALAVGIRAVVSKAQGGDLLLSQARAILGLPEFSNLPQSFPPCIPLYGGVLSFFKVWRSLRPKAAQKMNNSTTYSWQGAYQCAVLETNPAQIAQRIDDALRAIEQRVGSTIRIDSAENEAIESTRNAIAYPGANGSAAYPNP